MEDLLQLVCRATQQNIDWNGFEAALSSFVIPMSQTEQNPRFHAEGDVWTHTKLVCEALVQLKAFSALTAEKQQFVFLAALLHDIGKVPTTRWEDNRWVSPNHSIVGAKMARRFLWQELGLCGTVEKQQFRETVCNLIRYHSFPPHALETPDGKRRMLAIAANGQLCPMFSVELLCILCAADALGRSCTDRSEMEEQISLCEELAKENQCFRAPFPFPTDHTRHAYLSGRDIAPEVPLYNDTWGEVILMSGLPGTGKDTWIHEDCPDLPMVSLDEIRKALNIAPTDNQTKVVETAREQAKTYLRKQQSFVWNATNLSPMIRTKQLQLFSDYGAATRIVYLETPWDEELRRNAGRISAVPEQAICRMLDDLAPPEAKEAHTVQWHCI